MTTLIIAEAGVNHNGDIGIAKRLIDVASAAGADFIKFQTFNADRLVTRYARKADYQSHATDSSESQYSMLKRLEINESMHIELVAHCSYREIGFLSTGFDIESVDLLVRLGQEVIKIPSGEITNLPYLRHIGSLGKHVIVSSGMATLGDLDAAISELERAGTQRTNITVLHCTTEYPAPMAEVNLRAIPTIRAAFGVNVGYSDHTEGLEVPIAAVALGASIIEKHFTLDRTMDGPDHKASIEPHDLQNMVETIRNIELALGDGVKRPTPSEIKNQLVVRKSLVAKRPISSGEVFSNDNITAKRPGNGISPMRWDEVIGRKASRDYSLDELIQI